jgi:hypothetical protein
MNLRTLGIAFVLLALGCGAAEACVCDKPGSTTSANWLMGTGAAATHVFLARVTDVTSTDKKTELDMRVKIEILERFKGDAQFESIGITPCQNWEPKQGDVRVFFVSAAGIIVPCSDYRPFISDEELLRKLRLKRGH